MPMLADARREKFAQGVADGLSQAEAYRQASPKQAARWKDTTVWVEASKLMADSICETDRAWASAPATTKPSACVRTTTAGPQGYHGMGKRRFEAAYGVTERELLSNVRRLLEA